MEFILLVLVGVFVGTVGTIVGSGGGFLLVPLLLFTTDLSPQLIAGTSLTVVLLTAVSGTLSYYRQRIIDYKLGKLFIIAMIPGTIIGVHLNQSISLQDFTAALGIILMTVSVFLLKGFQLKIPHFIPRPIHTNSRVIDSRGKVFEYVVSLRRTVVLSFLIGVISPILGIGGGVLRTPSMIMILGIPTRIAAATSQLVTLAGSIIAVTLFARYSQIDYGLAVPLGLGVVAGAQAGVLFSKRKNTEVLRKIMAYALFFVGTWMLVKSFM